jgi:hypothetical protein
LSPFANGFEFSSRTFSIGLLGDIIFPSVFGKTWASFQLFLLDYSERLFFQVVSETLGQVFNFFYWTTWRDYFSKWFRKDLGKFSTFSIRLLGEIIFPSVSGKTRTSFQLFFRLQTVQRRGRLRLLSNPPEWTLTPFTRKLLFILEKMESLGVSIVPASIVLEFLVVNGFVP